MRFGEFELDLSGMELRRAGRVVHVEPQVFEVLAPPRVAPRPGGLQGGAAGLGLGNHLRLGVRADQPDQVGATGGGRLQDLPPIARLLGHTVEGITEPGDGRVVFAIRKAGLA